MPSGIGIPRPPETEDERHVLKKLCLQTARQRGARGKEVEVEATRLYYETIEDSKKAVKDPSTQPGLLFRIPPPKGGVQTPGGLYIPTPTRKKGGGKLK